MVHLLVAIAVVAMAAYAVNMITVELPRHRSVSLVTLLLANCGA
jgi:hypothetical protein